MNKLAVDNLSYISAATRYNTEKRAMLRWGFDRVLTSGDVFNHEITKSDISDYAGNLDLENSDPELPEKWLQHLLLIYPDDPDPRHYQMFLQMRYADMSEQVRNELGFSIVDMLSVEAFIRNKISDKAECYNIDSDYHTFKNKQEYTELRDFEEPPQSFEDDWLSCIEFSRAELINEFIDDTENQQLAQELSLSKRIDMVNSIIGTLSSEFSKDVNHSRYQFLKTPLLKIPEKEDCIVVPFPSVLLTTSHFRVGLLFQQHRQLKSIEDSQKGDIVEELALKALSGFDSRNLVESFRYNDPHPREADGLLLFEDSFWAVEVKSHPIFRKFPDDIQTGLGRFKKKTKESIEQGEKTLEFLREQERGNKLLYNLTGEKSYDDKEYGMIIVLDGLLPTLFSQSQMMDELFGMGDVYDELEKDDRVWVVSLFELFELADQIEERDRLEDFILWRTDFGFQMPVISFTERDYWAMYFDNYDTDQAFKEEIDRAAQEEIHFYISDRFNDKPHIPENGS